MQAIDALAPRSDLQLRLVPSGDGWSLMTLDAQCVFHAPGPGARHRCLEFALNAGALSVLG
jgi:hypothetical protein